MKPANCTIAGLLFLATCGEGDRERSSSNAESTTRALGTVPPTEVAVWQKVSSVDLPAGRQLQAAAFDEARQVVVMFGGATSSTPNRETWEWNPKTGKWTNRTGNGIAPDARSGASLVFDSDRGKLVLFGGRAGSGLNLEDTWEWEPTNGAWTNVSGAGAHPSARTQQGMVYEKGTGKVLLFGGGRNSTAYPEEMGIAVSLGDTWEYDPVAAAWKQLAPAATPTVRHDFGLVWDTARRKAVLFGGMQIDKPNTTGIFKQDTWEWDPTTAAWSERATTGKRPPQRHAHAMAFDGKRGRVMVFGGFGASSGPDGSMNDLWELDPKTFSWTQLLQEGASGSPLPRMYASLVSDDASGLLELVAGFVNNPISGWQDSWDVWELDPAKPAFTDRSLAPGMPSLRQYQTMAFNPAAGRTYLFGGCDWQTMQALDDLWEWDGKAWTKIAVDGRPPPRCNAALAYDPVRKSLILFGGMDYNQGIPYRDTWELGASKKWTELKPAVHPGALDGHGMVTDTARGKILLFAGTLEDPTPSPAIDPSNEVWEWDGAKATWTNRTPSDNPDAPMGRQFPLLSYDEGRQKLFVFEGTAYSVLPFSYREWDPVTAGWSSHGTDDSLDAGPTMLVAYDSIRRRQVLLTDSLEAVSGRQTTAEIDTKSETVYIQAPATLPGTGWGGSMVFDSTRGVMVVYGGSRPGHPFTNDTWEYKVTNLGNGEGCTAAFAGLCAGGLCIDGVCCDSTCPGASGLDGGDGGLGPAVGGNDGGAAAAGGAGGYAPGFGGATASTGFAGAGGSPPPAGGSSQSSGTGGIAPSASGAGGNTVRVDAGAPSGLGGSGGAQDAGARDAGNTTLRRSGCSCDLGGSGPAAPAAPFWFVGCAILLSCRRSRRSRSQCFSPAQVLPVRCSPPRWPWRASHARRNKDAHPAPRKATMVRARAPRPCT